MRTCPPSLHAYAGSPWPAAPCQRSPATCDSQDSRDGPPMPTGSPALVSLRHPRAGRGAGAPKGIACAGILPLSVAPPRPSTPCGP
eukprot:14526857-Alexandrium_andersonii.AAC.1